MRMLKGFTVAAICGLSACGVQQKEKNDTNPNAQATQQAPAGLPEGAIIAVPVDAQGKEIPAQAQLKLLPTVPSDSSGASLSQAFAQGKEPDQMINELDQSSSTQSFYGWHNYRGMGDGDYDRYNRNGGHRQVGYGYGNQGGYGYGAHGNNYGCNSYQRYQPTYYYSGNPYAWNYQSQYQSLSMNYYYYNRPQTGINQYPSNQGYGQMRPIGYHN